MRAALALFLIASIGFVPRSTGTTTKLKASITSKTWMTVDVNDFKPCDWNDCRKLQRADESACKKRSNAKSDYYTTENICDHSSSSCPLRIKLRSGDSSEIFLWSSTGGQGCSKKIVDKSKAVVLEEHEADIELDLPLIQSLGYELNQKPFPNISSGQGVVKNKLISENRWKLAIRYWGKKPTSDLIKIGERNITVDY